MPLEKTIPFQYNSGTEFTGTLEKGILVGDRSKKRSPPYVSYKSFNTLLSDLRQGGIPARLDRSYWGGKFSGSTGTQLMSALRFLNLIDPNGIPNGQLKDLVNARGTTKIDILRKVGRESFTFLAGTAFDPEKSTYAQLEEVFKDTYNVDRDVCRKCIKFFIELAGEAEIPLSQFITKRASSSKISAPAEKVPKRPGTRTNQNAIVPLVAESIPHTNSWQELLLTKFPAFDPTWSADVQLKWFEAFDELLKRGFVPGNYR